MRQPQEIVGPAIWNRMEGAFRKWVKWDSYASRMNKPRNVHQAGSVRELIGNMFHFDAQVGLWKGRERARCTLEMTLGELLSREIVMDDRTTRRPVEVVFMKGLCLTNLTSLMGEASSMSCSGEEAERQWAELAAGAGCGSWREVCSRVAEIDNGVDLSRALMAIVREELADKPLWDFFRRGPSEHGYVSWWPGATTGQGEPLKTRETKSESGIVRTRVARYEDTSDAGVRAYEWSAELRSVSDDVFPSAAACGMVYVLPREEGILMCSPSALRWAADAVADTDVAQVMAFLQQHEDAPERMAEGDLCFVWLWERRGGSERGRGAEVLIAAMGDLKRRFRGLKTVIVNLEPAQFAGQALAQDPPEVQTARQEASEKLERHLHAVAPQQLLKGELRLVASRRMSADETLASLGKADLLGR